MKLGPNYLFQSKNVAPFSVFRYRFLALYKGLLPKVMRLGPGNDALTTYVLPSLLFWHLCFGCLWDSATPQKFTTPGESENVRTKVISSSYRKHPLKTLYLCLKILLTALLEANERHRYVNGKRSIATQAWVSSKSHTVASGWVEDFTEKAIC